jgi:ubiquinone/menaquinone biosynthesis C-methylase UbiE
MTKEAEPRVDERIIQVLRHLGIARAHIGARMTADWQGLATRETDLIASLTLVCPPAIDPNVLSPVASRLAVFTGDQGLPAEQLRRSLAGLPDATLITLRNYLGMLWADVAADRTQEVGTAMLDALQRADLRHRGKAVVLPEGEGEVAGIAYRIRGAGPPLVLLPLALAPSQWEPLLPMLSARYCTIILSGAALGVVALLEERGRSGYLSAVRNLIDAVRVRRGEVVLEVGCGSGVLTRWLARQTNGANRIVGIDISRYLLREAAALARKEGLADAITFQEGNAEALPFPDNSVDVAMACTVLEEGDADRMLAEMVRVTRPGGRVAVIVRTIDVPWVVNLPLRAALKAKVESPGRMGSGVTAQGCADASIYRRFHASGLSHLTLFPQLVAVTKTEQQFATFQHQNLSTLSPEEIDEWRTAAAQAEAEGTVFIAYPLHCAVGVKP